MLTGGLMSDVGRRHHKGLPLIHGRRHVAARCQHNKVRHVGVGLSPRRLACAVVWAEELELPCYAALPSDNTGWVPPHRAPCGDDSVSKARKRSLRGRDFSQLFSSAPARHRR